MLEDFPLSHGPDRENLILDIVKNQQDRLSYEWCSLKVEHNGHNGVFFVMTDALKIDGIRINVTADTEQRIADHWGASLMTAKISDLIWHNADIRLKPCLRSITSSTQAMIEHSQDIDKQLDGVDYDGKLLSTIGKHWILSNKLLYKTGMVCNHGWHFEGNNFQGIKGNINPSLLKNPLNKMYWRMIQAEGTRHNNMHCDYSQICRLMTRECEIDGKKMDLLDVFKNKELSKLINNDGILHYTRINSVVKPNTIVVI